ncbi:mechanosensitive ion channel [Reyranella sp. MMS21-HV4-11]|jgi:small-conductance mechanosensitive channel|uniref:Mechanosensitive ion channel n=1 Tax=Reyranella humidisoli TaxID=2849149 RepID=A0ABS6IKW8_9HYPH|nr:mechanosensitive ion channel domain-containing protein [Reyranella sp. MMS21-HV4-11]MBU8874971.1 mechanosensitive ion channel [Reyranella sp. MMS21-HV4-11]
MKRSSSGSASAISGLVGVWAFPAAAQAVTAGEGAAASFLMLMTERFEFTFAQLPALGAHLLALPQVVGGRTALLLVGIVVAGLVAEGIARLILSRARVSAFDRLASKTPLRAFLRALLLDVLALVALAVAGRLVLGQLGTPDSVAGKLGSLVLHTLVYWRGFNLVFRAFLRPSTPEGRIAPVDDGAARRLLVALNLVVLLPMLASLAARALAATGANREITSAAIMLYVPVIAVLLLLIVWRYRLDMAAWLTAMVPSTGFSRQLKLDAARNWWMAGLAFYALLGLAAVYAALTESGTAARGMATIESALVALLLFETLMHRITRHIVSELPMAGDVVADCVRLLVRLYVAILVAEALMVRVLAAATPEEWGPHDRGAKIAALSAVAIYAGWRFLKYRMDSYIASNPLPSADVSGDSEEDVQVAASRLRTLMPLLRVVAGATIAVVGGLLVLSELGVNITPLIAGASVFGLAVSFGSQSLVRDIVSGIFFLAEDSFRIGEYVDCSKVKGTVEGFSVRSLKLRHQNGQLHIVPFGQVGHITNFSRDWTVVKFNIAFANGTDVELLRKTVKKIGLQMMEEPTFKPILLQPLKMQGVVDIKDNSLIVRFKFMARPKNPTMVQRMAIRRMYDQFPALGIQFATGNNYLFPVPATPSVPPQAAEAAPKAAE